MGFFRHGKMDNPGHAIKVFDDHFSTYSNFPKGPFVFLEIGPGDSLFSAIIASSKGATLSYMIDSGDYVSKDIDGYLKLIEKLYGSDYLNNKTFKNFEDIKQRFNIIHMTNGLESIKLLPEKIVDLSFSNACFEHIDKNEVLEYFKELKRVSKASSFSSHCVDFKDHLSYSLNNLRFSNHFWGSKIVKKSGIYTNRLRFSDIKLAIEEAGFACQVTEVKKWDLLPTPVNKMHKDFQIYKIEDLLIKEAWFKLT